MMLDLKADLRRGQLVRSQAGRDRGNYYLLFDRLNDRLVQLVDGVKHPLARPKPKNLKHLGLTKLVASEIETALASGTIVADLQITSAISRLRNELEEGDRLHG